MLKINKCFGSGWFWTFSSTCCPCHPKEIYEFFLLSCTIHETIKKFTNIHETFFSPLQNRNMHCGRFCEDWKTKTKTKNTVALAVKNLPANAGDVRDVKAISEMGRSCRGGYGNPRQYSCLENPRGTWWAIVDGIAKSQTRLKQLSMHAYKIVTQKNGIFKPNNYNSRKYA